MRVRDLVAACGVFIVASLAVRCGTGVSGFGDAGPGDDLAACVKDDTTPLQAPTPH